MYSELSIEELRNEVKMYLIIYEPSKYLKESIKSTKDIYDHRKLLQQASFSNFIIEYLAKLILNDVENGRRFRKADCIKVLKKIIKNNFEKLSIEPDVVRLLFKIYKLLIFEVSNECQWSLSVLIKNQLLTTSEIHWLIENWDKSVHLLNRLLLYPERNLFIEKWAEKIYKSNEFPDDREAEIVGLLIHDNIPPYVDCSDKRIILRGILRAKIPYDKKVTIIKSNISYKELPILFEIAERYNYPDLIKYIGEKIII